MNDTWWVKEEQLDDDQKAFASLGPDGSHLLVGPPGCGKTNLLLLRAKYMFLAGHTNILVIVFTKTLQEFIAHGSDAYGLPEGVVQTLRSWQVDFLRENGTKVKPQGTFEEQREFMGVQLSELITRKGIRDMYEAIFLDEVHDYTPREIQAFETLGRVITAAADIHQQIYSVDDCMEEVRSMVDDEHVLRYHYRLGLNICKLADGIKKGSGDYTPLVPTSNYNEALRPSSVDVFQCKSLDEQVEKALEKVRVQLKAYPDELLGILCPKIEELERIWELVSNSDVASIAMKQGGGDHCSFDGSKRIHVGTIHSAKGVEFRAVHFLCAESTRKFPHGNNMEFTAVTRTKTSLSVYHVGVLSGRLRQAIDGLKPLPALPSTKDLFAKRGRK